jgi:hypothetical protein
VIWISHKEHKDTEIFDRMNRIYRIDLGGAGKDVIGELEWNSENQGSR